MLKRVLSNQENSNNLNLNNLNLEIVANNQHQYHQRRDSSDNKNIYPLFLAKMTLDAAAQAPNVIMAAAGGRSADINGIKSDSFWTMFSITELISIVSSGFMIFGGVVPYVPQYQMIKRSRNAQGFSTLVCLSLLVANILRILFWFGHPYELPLLAQSVIMIVCMLIMLELCVRVKAEQHPPSVWRKFTDFDSKFIWKWTDFGSYLQFIMTFTLIGSFLVRLMINSTFFIELIGFLSVFTEAMLAAPQFYRNFVNKSTEGMSVSMVLMWTSGDIFKTTYFILRSAPVQFWLCGMLQVSLDLAVLSQVYMYSVRNKTFQ